MKNKARRRPPENKEEKEISIISHYITSVTKGDSDLMKSWPMKILGRTGILP